MRRQQGVRRARQAGFRGRVERLEDRVAPSDLLALLAAGALVGSISDETSDAEYVDDLAVDDSETAIFAEPTDATTSLDLGDFIEGDDSASGRGDEQSDDAPVNSGDSEPAERPIPRNVDAFDALYAELTADLSVGFLVDLPAIDGATEPSAPSLGAAVEVAPSSAGGGGHARL